jgi:glycine hydroxymethyltransferase
LKASGVRYGTPWMTQRGLDEIDMVLVADIIADVLFAVTPYTINSRKGRYNEPKLISRFWKKQKFVFENW